MKKIYYTTEEVMELLRVSYPTLLRWNKKGVLAYIKIENKLLYPCEFIDGLLKKAYKVIE